MCWARNRLRNWIWIDADKDTPYENVAKVLEAAKDAGIAKVGFRLENTKQ